MDSLKDETEKKNYMKNLKKLVAYITIELMEVISDGAHAMTLCHYPLLSWKHAKTSYMIHGHIHAKTDMDFWPLIAARENVLNAGVDLNGFQPVPFDELLANNIHFKEEHPA